MKSRFLTFLFALGCISAANAQDSFVETSDMGTTDWVEGYIEATAQGTSRYMGNRVQEELMAKQAARTMAQSRLLEIIKGIRVTGITTLGAQAQSDTRAATRIKGTLRGAQTISEIAQWHKDTSSRRGEVVMAEVTLRLCMRPSCQSTKQNLTQASFDLPTPRKAALIKDKNEEPSGYSAVIIDLEQALFLPALAPEIINEDEKTLYSQDTVKELSSLEKGLIHYSKSVSKAQKLEISGANPFIIKAKRITANNRIVLSNEDGKQISNLDALKQGRLIVALD